MTGVSPVQGYGTTIQGMAMSTLKKQRTNIAMATSDYTGGACVTTLLRWHYPRTNGHADPHLTYPTAQLKTWIRLCSKQTRSIQNVIAELWTNAYRRLSESKNKWNMAKGPMTATIAMLLDLGLKPIHPQVYHHKAEDGEIYALKPCHDEHSINRVIHEITMISEKQIWKQASQQYMGGGLDKGPPYLQPVMKAYQTLNAQGKCGQAQSLKCVVLNKAWCGHRLAESTDPPPLTAHARDVTRAVSTHLCIDTMSARIMIALMTP